MNAFWKVLSAAVLMFMGLAAPSVSLAQGLSRIVTPSDSRILETPEMRLLSVDEDGKPRAAFEFSLAAFGARGENDSTLYSAPFELMAKLPDGVTRLKLTGGYSRADVRDASARGIDDLAFHVGRCLAPLAGGQLWGAVIISVPTASDTSVGHAMQSLALYQAAPLAGGGWEYLISAATTHTNASHSPGVSPYATSATLRLVRVMSPIEKLRLQFDAAHRSGARTVNSLSGAYEFPVSTTFFGSASVARTLTDGFRATALALNITRVF